MDGPNQFILSKIQFLRDRMSATNPSRNPYGFDKIMRLNEEKILKQFPPLFVAGIRLVIAGDKMALIDVRRGKIKNKCEQLWKIGEPAMELLGDRQPKYFNDNSTPDGIEIFAYETAENEFFVPIAENREHSVAKMAILIAVKMAKRYKYPLNVEFNQPVYADIVLEIQHGNFRSCTRLEIVRHSALRDKRKLFANKPYIEQILNTLDIKEHLKISGSVDLDLTPNVRNIRCELVLNNAPDDYVYILKLPYPQVKVELGYFNINMLNLFLIKWLNGGAETLKVVQFVSNHASLQRLESLSNNISLYPARESFEFRPPNYFWENYPSNEPMVYRSHKLVNCTVGFDMIRDCDGKRASLTNDRTSVYFVAWEPNALENMLRADALAQLEANPDPIPDMHEPLWVDD